jgi:site-specific recombinase XerD
MKVTERHAIKIRPNTLYIRFWERKSENPQKPNTANITCKLTYSQKVKNYAVGIPCTIGDLDPDTLTIQNNPVGTLVIKNLHAALQSAFAEMKLTGRKIDTRAIWQVANGLTLNVNLPTVADCLTLFLDQITLQHTTGEIGKSVVEKVTKWNARILEYITNRHGQNAQLDTITPAEAKNFYLWLKNDCMYSVNYSAYIVQHLKRVLNYAVENEWITRNPFLNYRRKLEKTKGDILTEDEIDTIRTLDLFAPALDHIRKAFIFQAMTGLSYAELVRVTTDHIIIDEKTGAEYIKIHRKKTDVPSIVPLNLEARIIIDQFQDHPMRIKKKLLVPIISNQRYNNYLKQLAGLTGIKKRLTSHCARRTAATYYLTKGVPMESISAMLGHTNITTTQESYATTRPQRVIEDFQKNNIKISKAQ